MAAELTVLGGGAWGTALALHAARAGRPARLWVHDPQRAAAIAARRVNETYLPGHTLPASVEVTSELGRALEGAREILVAVPSHHGRPVLAAARPHLGSEAVVCLASKGIENGTLLRPSQVAGAVLGKGTRLAVLCGPSFAQEVAAGHPTAVVVASDDAGAADRLQQGLSWGPLRAYTNDDVTGSELGGALKNVIAVGAGVVDGLGYGANTQAALITRGLAEISRLAEAMGGRRETLAGLAGLGDLVLTCTSGLSRNRRLGSALGRGETLASFQAATPHVAEGLRTTLSAHMLAGRLGVAMPITAQIHALLYEGKPAAEAIHELLGRRLTREGV
ncbi:MAG TPA: NAD(P)H-dependent glycerol-3-phosphate dehydrogenase [Candidatus Polarisedimenticolia bacterium]|nr:NAD(P)H-dependent glycerol-3-phosphate dehydrogenase [Candidatus Polarisedimenticolia bacterium]